MAKETKSVVNSIAELSKLSSYKAEKQYNYYYIWYNGKKKDEYFIQYDDEQHIFYVINDNNEMNMTVEQISRSAIKIAIVNKRFFNTGRYNE